MRFRLLGWLLRFFFRAWLSERSLTRESLSFIISAFFRSLGSLGDTFCVSFGWRCNFLGGVLGVGVSGSPRNWSTWAINFFRFSGESFSGLEVFLTWVLTCLVVTVDFESSTSGTNELRFSEVKPKFNPTELGLCLPFEWFLTPDFYFLWLPVESLLWLGSANTEEIWYFPRSSDWLGRWFLETTVFARQNSRVPIISSLFIV